MHRVLLLLLLFLNACATPVTGDFAITGGASEQRISESTYVVKAELNGFTAAAALKPTILRRAKLVGELQGFKSFQIESFNVSYDYRGNGYSSEARVLFSRTLDDPVPSWRYQVASESVVAYKAEPSAADLRGLVKLSGSSRREPSGARVLIEPAFIDAIGSNRNSWTSDVSDTYVQPGRLEFAAYVRASEGAFGRMGAALVAVRALVAPNSTYTLVGRLVDGSVEYWIEDDLTKKPINAPERRSILLR